MSQKLFLLCTTLFSSLYAELPVRIFTHVYNRPDFIELHVKTFKAFLKEEFEYIVFNDAPNEGMKRVIEETCQNLNVQCIRVPDHAPHRQSPGCRHMDGLALSMEQFAYDYDGIVMIVDSDMFLIRPFSVKEYMGSYDFVGGYEYRCRNGARFDTPEEQFVNGAQFIDDGNQFTYTSPCLVFMNMPKLPNRNTISFEGGSLSGVMVDTGGHSYYYFKNNPEVPLKLYVAVSKDFLVTLPKSLAEYGFDKNSVDLIMNNRREYGFQFHADTHFLHFYAGGSNWPGYTADFIQQKTNLVNQYVDLQIADYKNR